MDLLRCCRMTLIPAVEKNKEVKTPTENIQGHSEATRKLYFKTERGLEKALLKAYHYSEVFLIVLAGEFSGNSVLV